LPPTPLPYTPLSRSRLYKAIKEIIEKYDPPAVFVYQTCVPAMTGDDINAVCKAASAKFGKPCIPVNSPGFVGPKNLGNKLAELRSEEHTSELQSHLN